MRRAGARGRQRGRLVRPRAERYAPVAGSRRPKGPRAPQWAKRTAPEGTARRRYSASARAIRPPWTERPSAAARRRKLGAGTDAASRAKAVCAYAPAQWVWCKKFPYTTRGAALSAADMERMSRQANS